MRSKNYPNHDLERLRLMAEGLLNTGEDQSFRELSEMDAIKMLHELQVHQIELEMQNQELMAAKERVEVANSRYQELYNTSLSGLFTLTDEAVILDLNETGAHMLGKDRSGLKKSNFRFFISDETKPGFNDFIETIFKTDLRQSCDVTIKSNGITRFHLFLTGIAAGEGNQCFISAIDLTERSRSEKIHQARLDLIQFSENHSWDDLLEETLNQAEQLTGSIIGFYHCLDEDQKTLTLQNWSSRTKNVYCKAEGKGLHFQLSEAGIWADCLRESRPVIHNNYHALAYKKGLPPGHAALDRELLVPVIRNGKVKAVLGVGNKPEDYVETDVEMVSLLADLAWDITERKKYEVRIMEDEEKWRTLFNLSG